MTSYHKIGLRHAQGGRVGGPSQKSSWPAKKILTFSPPENILFSCLRPWEVYIGFQKEDQRKTHRGGDRLVDECSNPGRLQVLHLAG
jgi:hypothetical protein